MLSPQYGGQTVTFGELAKPKPLDVYTIGRELLPDADLTPPVPAPQDSVGDIRQFAVYNFETMSRFTVSARHCVATQNADFYVQEGIGLTCSAFDSAAERFENRIRPTVIGNFAGSQLKASDLRIAILHADLPGIGGYFDSGDLLPTAINPYANGRPTLYLNAQRHGSGNPNNPFYDNLVAHEFQHAIHHQTDPDEETWINEGLSILAEQYFTPTRHFAYFLSTCGPAHIIAWPSTLGAARCNYAGVGLLMRYVRDNYPDTDGTLSQLVAEPTNGLRGLDAYLHTAGADIGALELMANWGVANYLDGRSTLDPYPDYEARARTTATLSERGQLSEYFTQFSAKYIALPVQPGIYDIEFQGDLFTPLLPDVDTTDGSFWHAGGSDSAVYSLSKSFDLRAAEAENAVLTLLLRYDTEQGWDYVYATVSNDGGDTWRVLRSPAMADPSDIALGQRFGPGFTGVSGDGPMPEWILEEFDLSDFIGESVLFRLIYITDLSINLDGVSIGGAWLPGVSYGWASIAHDVPEALAALTQHERPDGGWVQDGFFYSNSLVQQDYAIRLMTVSRDGLAATGAMQIDENGHGILRFDNVQGDIVDAALMVMPMAPLTRQPAQATLSIGAIMDEE